MPEPPERPPGDGRVVGCPGHKETWHRSSSHYQVQSTRWTYLCRWMGRNSLASRSALSIAYHTTLQHSSHSISYTAHHHTMLRRTTSHHAIWLRILGPPVKCAVPKRVRNAQVSVADNAKLWSNNVRTRAPKWEGLPPVSQKRGQGTACARWRAPPPQFATPIFHPNVSEDGYVWHPYASHYDGSRHRLADLVYHLAVLFAEVSPPSTP